MPRTANDSRKREPQSQYGTGSGVATQKSSGQADEKSAPSQASTGSHTGTKYAPDQGAGGSKFDQFDVPAKMGEASHSKRTVVDAGSTDSHKADV